MHLSKADLTPEWGELHWMQVIPAFCKLNKKMLRGRSRRGAAETNPTRTHEVSGSIPGLTLWAKDPALP